MQLDPSGHPELSAAAEALPPEKLESKADRAVVLLELTGSNYPESESDQLLLAVVLQVNRLVRLEARGGGDPDVTSESKGSQSRSYARDARGGAPEVLDSEAASIVARVKQRVATQFGAPLPASRTTANQFVW